MACFPIRTALAALPILALAACSGAPSADGSPEIRHVDLNQCSDWDWRGQGEEDAKRGIPADQALAAYDNDCAPVGQGPDRGLYMDGYDAAK